MLQRISPERLRQVAADERFLQNYDDVMARRDEARGQVHPWWSEHGNTVNGGTIAYFSAEFALHQSLPIYAGGLGVLAGDHCKEASDLGVPLVGVGFMYPQGYFHQRMSNEGWQEERYERLSWTEAPIEAALTPDGRPCVTAVPLGDRTVLAAVWRVRLGRVRLFLLDTDLAENAPWDRELSARLYGGDREMRIQQEIILGIGGVRALRALGVSPTVWHLNEGHAAFVALQRIREQVEKGASFDAALDAVRRSTVFTTHTPVPAGHDAFPFSMVEKHLAGCWGEMGVHRERFLALGQHDSGHGALFNMTALAMRTAEHINAVSALHGEVTRTMWRSIWPDTPADRLPIRFITNGVHLPTWMSARVLDLLTTSLGPGWVERVDEATFADELAAIPDAGLWALREELRLDLFEYIRERIRSRWADERVGPNRVVAAGAMLDPHVLTLGYARRFTSYKRPELIFHDPDRLARILNNVDCPVQIVFAGKAHPADEPGQAAPPAGVQELPQPDLRRAHRVRGRLRHARRPLPGARLRRVAEQPAQAARGQRHQRHEGGDERSAPPEHRRRVVGRGLQRRQRMADRRSGPARRSGRDGRRRCRGALYAAGTRGRPRLLRS